MKKKSNLTQTFTWILSLVFMNSFSIASFLSLLYFNCKTFACKYELYESVHPTTKNYSSEFEELRFTFERSNFLFVLCPFAAVFFAETYSPGFWWEKASPLQTSRSNCGYAFAKFSSDAWRQESLSTSFEPNRTKEFRRRANMYSVEFNR